MRPGDLVIVGHDYGIVTAVYYGTIFVRHAAGIREHSRSDCIPFPMPIDRPHRMTPQESLSRKRKLELR